MKSKQTKSNPVYKEDLALNNLQRLIYRKTKQICPIV